MPEVRLRGKHGLISILDDADADLAWIHSWHYHHPQRSLTRYARARIDQKTVFLHRLVLANAGIEIPDDMVVDHIDRNGMNNSRDNLRVVTRSENNSFRPRPSLTSRRIRRSTKLLSDGTHKTYYYFRPTNTRIIGSPGDTDFETALRQLQNEFAENWQPR